jgi:translation elongation factor EF-Ts
LAASGNDFDKACELIEQQLASDGQKKASKVQNRVAQQGLITILQRPGLGAVMLEVFLVILVHEKVIKYRDS